MAGELLQPVAAAGALFTAVDQQLGGLNGITTPAVLVQVHWHTACGQQA
jgi:hypothetical protein